MPAGPTSLWTLKGGKGGGEQTKSEGVADALAGSGQDLVEHR